MFLPEDQIASIDLADTDRALADRSFYDFVEMSWDEVEPASKFIPNWHIEAIAEHLQYTIDGDLTRLVINVPPGSGKSLLCCVFYPAWVWVKDARKKTIFASYSDRIAFRDARRTRSLVNSQWYKERWGESVRLRTDEQAIAKFSTDKGGFRLATTVRGGVTGEHADIQMADDPIKPFDVTGSLHTSKRALDDVLRWWTETMASRLTSFDKAVRIIIMQRLHENDLAGAMLKDMGYEHLMLPMEFEPKRKCFIETTGFEDPRIKEGELLFEERFPQEAVNRIRKDLGSRGAHAQLQQNPIPAEGSIIKESYFRFYDQLPPRFHLIVQSWDCTFKDGDTTDYVVGQVWGMFNEQYYLIDQVRDRMGFVDTCRAVRMLSAKWPKAIFKIVEDKANGPAVVDALKKDIAGFKLVNPEGGKIARCHAVEPLWESGNVFVPKPENAPWVNEFIEEITGFPARAHDDQVDGMTQALVFLRKKHFGRLREALDKI